MSCCRCPVCPVVLPTSQQANSEQRKNPFISDDLDSSPLTEPLNLTVERIQYNGCTIGQGCLNGNRLR